MSSTAIFFYLISAFILVMAIASVTSRHIFRSAIWLLFSLLGVAGLYFLMDLNFLAAVQISVYVGGIMILILFGIFLTQKSGEKLPAPGKKRVIFSILASLFGSLLTWHLLWWNSMFQSISFGMAGQEIDADVSKIGLLMLFSGDGGYSLPFELVSVLLLAAMIGCIVIAIKLKPDKKC